MSSIWFQFSSNSKSSHLLLCLFNQHLLCGCFSLLLHKLIRLLSLIWPFYIMLSTSSVICSFQSYSIHSVCVWVCVREYKSMRACVSSFIRWAIVRFNTSDVATFFFISQFRRFFRLFSSSCFESLFIPKHKGIRALNAFFRTKTTQLKFK